MTIGTLLASLPQRTRVPFGANLPRLMADTPSDWPDGTEAPERPEQTCDRTPTNPGRAR